VEDAAIVLIDTELPGAPYLLCEVASKVVLHYSWVNKSLNAGGPLLEASNWGDCRVTPENIGQDFGYVPPPPSTNPRLQTHRPTPEGHPYGFSAPFRFSQSSAGAAPPSSQPPYTPTPSQRSLESVMPQQQTPQQPPANQMVPYNSQPRQPSSTFPFPTSQPTDIGATTSGQQRAWSPFHPGPYGMAQPPTMEDVRRASEIVMTVMWFHQQFPPPPTPTQPNAAFHPPPPPPTQDPPNTINTQPEASGVPGAAAAVTVSCQDSTYSDDLGNFLGGPSSKALLTHSLVHSDPTPYSPPDNTTGQLTASTAPRIHPRLFEYDVEYNTAGQLTASTPPRIHPKLFEHDVEKPIVFCVPIILRNRGKIAEILRVSF
jgi:hypothetical protein